MITRTNWGRGGPRRGLLGEGLLICELVFYSSANDLVRFEFANDSICVNAPSRLST